MATDSKKYKLIYPFDINDMKKQIVDKEFLERDCGFCFHGSAAMSYLENKDIRTFRELRTEERNSYYTKAFFVVFIMYIITTVAVVYVDRYFCIHKGVYKRFKTFVKLNINLILGLSFVCGFLLSCFMVCIKAVQRKPFNIFMLLLELIMKIVWVCAIAVKYKTHIMIAYSFTFTILSLICVGLGQTAFDFESLYDLSILASIEIAISFCSSVVTFSLLCKTLDITLVGVTVAFCLFSFVILIIQMSHITNGRTMELTKYEYIVGAFLLYQPLVNICLFFLRTFNMYFNTIDVPDEVPKNVPQSKRIYVWKFR